ncbi:MAG: hypothetical protein KBT88_10230 [Gammaproteobacteria bacterium]|nr:hypothetical protein [Gammaproteobacteria bacterium]MBQ0840151.1 hypothetical protein [Gammaproteobacteria bacterium]
MEVSDCHKCGAPQQAFERDCPSCGEHLGFPNVLLANSSLELEALESRFQSSLSKCVMNRSSSEFSTLVELIAKTSHVVVSVPVDIALKIVTDPLTLYVNYEKLVGAGVRSRGSFANDSHRKIVAGALFGSFGDQILYGALSLNGRGLATYGDIYCTLKGDSISKRTSFLEENSYDFSQKYKDEQLPNGYRCDWGNRDKLVAIKLESEGLIKKSSDPKKWPSLVLNCDGVDRSKDKFVEAHIYGSFNIYSIDKIVVSEFMKESVLNKSMAEAIVDAFNNTAS